MDPEVGELRAFVAVSEELHFGRAAVRLGISQPQVSRRIRTLEERLGVELFVRTARRTALTDAGSLLLRDAREALAALTRLSDNALLARRGGGGRVSVAFLWSTLGGYLAPLVSAAAERHPEIELSVAQVTFLELLPALRRGDVDLALSRPTYATTEMVELELRGEPAMLAVHPDHPFAAQEHVAVAQLSGQPVISLRRELVATAYDAILARARAAGLRARATMTAAFVGVWTRLGAPVPRQVPPVPAWRNVLPSHAQPLAKTSQ